MGAHHDHHHDHGHGHGHGHNHAHGHAAPARLEARWIIGVALNLGFVVVEGIAGLAAHSTALLADAGHNLSDVLGLVMGAVAVWLARRPADGRRTWGWGKATVLAALANAVALAFACGAIAWEAVARFGDTQVPASGLIMITAAVGVAVNGATALLFLRGREDANVRGAFLHMAADAVVSAGVIAAGALILWTGKGWIDPAVSLVVVAVVLWGTWGLFREAVDLAMDAAPKHIDVEAVMACLTDLEGVVAVHDLHIWPTSTRDVALTAHLVRPGGGDDAFLRGVAETLQHRFAIAHATLQVESESIEDCERLHG